MKFNELLHDAVDINVLGTKKIVDLVQSFDKLKSFVHVSTLYSNCNRKDIDEKIYDHIINYHQLIPLAKIMKHMNTKDRRGMEEILFQNLPNSYTLTKHFAEKLVSHQAFFMPTGIFRPPVVVSSAKDFPGYTDNLNGPSGETFKFPHFNIQNYLSLRYRCLVLSWLHSLHLWKCKYEIKSRSC